MFEKLFAARGLSLDRLRVLIEIHEAGSIAQAVPDDPIRQSQYSRQLRELSTFFGCEMAQRQGKYLKLTAPGRRLAELVRQQFQALEDFRADCQAESPSYTIAAGDSLLQWLVVPRLGPLSTGKSPVRFVTTNLRTRDIVQHVADGRADFGVIRADAVSEGLATAPLGALGYVAVVPAALCPAAKAPALRDVLGRLPFASASADGQFSQRLRAIADEVGATLQPALTCESFPQTLTAVRSGAFVAILPELALAELPARSATIVRDARLDRLQRPIVLVWSARLADVRPGARRVIERVTEVLRIASPAK